MCYVVDIKLKSNVAFELRDNIEMYCQPASYGAFLAKFVPIFMNLLDGEPSFMSNAPEQVWHRRK
jgi:transformation/transcription domain-associated protein